MAKRKAATRHKDEEAEKPQTNVNPSLRVAGAANAPSKKSDVLTPSGVRTAVRDAGDAFYGGRIVGTKEKVPEPTEEELADEDADGLTEDDRAINAKQRIADRRAPKKSKQQDEPMPEASDVSDEDLLACLAVAVPTGSVDKGFGASRGLTGDVVSWQAIADMLAELALPLSKMGLVALRNRIAATRWYEFIKRPLIGVLDAMIGNATETTTFSRSMQTRYESQSGDDSKKSKRGRKKASTRTDESGLSDDETTDESKE